MNHARDGLEEVYYFIKVCMRVLTGFNRFATFKTYGFESNFNDSAYAFCKLSPSNNLPTSNMVTFLHHLPVI